MPQYVRRHLEVLTRPPVGIRLSRHSLQDEEELIARQPLPRAGRKQWPLSLRA